MKISLNWIRDYVTFDLSSQDIADRLTMVGLEVEEIHALAPPFSGVVVGKILKIQKHPHADKLVVCEVDVGRKQTLQVVCGAPNTAEGQVVPVATVGAILQEGQAIEAATLRGIQSEGMICSERELGISDDHSGILVLDPDQHQIGELFSDHLPSDTVLEVNVTPNRPDCLSHIGIAREVSVIVGNPLMRPAISLKESDPSSDHWIAVDILDPDACPRYCARVVRDVKIGPSPRWMKERLEAVGIRSINNVVDVTNFILMETGQPLHGFDYDLIQGRRIVVRKAAQGEAFTTLDGQKRVLESDDLLICDGERAVALAGVMGGLNSEITETTKHILIESAYFDAMTVRKTAKRLGMSTEASQRFERGVDPNNAQYAADRAAQLLAELAGGTVARGVVDAHPKPISTWTVPLRFPRIQHVLGGPVPREQVLSILTELGLSVQDSDPLQVTIPTFRPDLVCEIDLIEEIVRHFGFDQIEPRLTDTITLSHSRNREDKFIETLRDHFIGQGFLEAQNPSMVSAEHVQVMDSRIDPLPIQNPISPDMAFMRTSLIPGLLDCVHWNRNRSAPHIRMFEIGRIFSAKSASLPNEIVLASGVLSGLTHPQVFWSESSRMVNFFHAKGVVENLLTGLCMRGALFEKDDHPVFTSETSSAIMLGKTRIGYCGAVRSDILNQWNIDDHVFGFEIEVEKLFSNVTRVVYAPIPRFPSVKRDLAFVLNETIPVEDLIKQIRSTGGDLLQFVDLFDLYKGKQIPNGQKSVAFSLAFLSPDRTLTEEEVDPVVDAIIESVQETFHATLRS